MPCLKVDHARRDKIQRDIYKRIMGVREVPKMPPRPSIGAIGNLIDISNPFESGYSKEI